jgi:plastocyanin
MRTLFPSAATLLGIAAVAVGCGGSDPGPDDSAELTTVEVTPASTTLFTVAPGNTVQLAAVPKDQNGATMTGLGAPTYSSADETVATVEQNGAVTAIGAGTTEIRASLTAGGVSRTGTAMIAVEVAPSTATVTAPALEYVPRNVDVSAGGSVTWSFGSIHHTVTFTTAGAPSNVPELENGSASRAFPNSGTFQYQCDIHPVMSGVVRVH